MSLINQFRQQVRTYVYQPVYKGPFEYKKKAVMMSHFPFGANRITLEREMEEIKKIRELQIKDIDISPFHLVWRYKPFFGNSWKEKLVLRRLGLHQKECNIPIAIPNTPHYNAMLWEVKHLLRLKPLKFPNGIPTEEDIGSVKVDINTGEMLINSAFKIPTENLEKADAPGIFTGNYLRDYLKWASGLLGYAMPTMEGIKEIDGNHIKEYDTKMRNYHKHQHRFYLRK